MELNPCLQCIRRPFALTPTSSLSLCIDLTIFRPVVLLLLTVYDVSLCIKSRAANVCYVICKIHVYWGTKYRIKEKMNVYYGENHSLVNCQHEWNFWTKCNKTNTLFPRWGILLQVNFRVCKGSSERVCVRVDLCEDHRATWAKTNGNPFEYKPQGALGWLILFT